MSSIRIEWTRNTIPLTRGWVVRSRAKRPEVDLSSPQPIRRYRSESRGPVYPPGRPCSQLLGPKVWSLLVDSRSTASYGGDGCFAHGHRLELRDVLTGTPTHGERVSLDRCMSASNRVRLIRPVVQVWYPICRYDTSRRIGEPSRLSGSDTLS